MGGAYQAAFERERRRKAEAKAEALAAESAAVYNWDKIRGLEKRVEALARACELFAESLALELHKRQALEKQVMLMQTLPNQPLEKRIKHLEAVVYAEGAPPDAGMLEGVQ